MKLRVTLKALAAVALLLLLPAFLVDCGIDDYGVDGCTPDAAPRIDDFWRGPGETDVTFIAFGDSQFGGGAEDKNG